MKYFHNSNFILFFSSSCYIVQYDSEGDSGTADRKLYERLSSSCSFFLSLGIRRKGQMLCNTLENYSKRRRVCWDFNFCLGYFKLMFGKTRTFPMYSLHQIKNIHPISPQMFHNMHHNYCLVDVKVLCRFADQKLSSLLTALLALLYTLTT